jgi:hypothetical protein
MIILALFLLPALFSQTPLSAADSFFTLNSVEFAF